MSTPGPNEETWVQIRAAYEQAESLSSLARRFGTTRTTIRRHARDEGWLASPDLLASQVIQNPRATPQEISRATRANVVDIATRRGLEAQSPAVVEQVALTLEDLLARQLPLAMETTKLAEDLIAKARSGKLEPSGRDTLSGLLSTALSASRTATELVREIAGLKSGQPSLARSKATAMRRFVVKVPSELEKPPEDAKAEAS